MFQIHFCAQLPSLLAGQQDSGVSAPEATLNPGHSAQLLSAVINQSSLDLCLLNYLAQDWSSEYRLEFCFIYCSYFTSVLSLCPCFILIGQY